MRDQEGVRALIERAKEAADHALALGRLSGLDAVLVRRAREDLGAWGDPLLAMLKGADPPEAAFEFLAPVLSALFIIGAYAVLDTDGARSWFERLQAFKAQKGKAAKRGTKAKAVCEAVREAMKGPKQPSKIVAAKANERLSKAGHAKVSERTVRRIIRDTKAGQS